jgi:uncharacterized protein
MLRLWREADEVIALSVGYVEVRATIARRLPNGAARRARRLLDTYWQQIETVAADDVLVDAAARIADEHRLRALDALHLAAARHVRQHDIVFVTWDNELARAARADSFATVGVGPD